MARDMGSGDDTFMGKDRGKIIVDEFDRAHKMHGTFGCRGGDNYLKTIITDEGMKSMAFHGLLGTLLFESRNLVGIDWANGAAWSRPRETVSNLD